MSVLRRLEERVAGASSLTADMRVPVTGARGFVEAAGLLRMKGAGQVRWKLEAPAPLNQSFVTDGLRGARRMIGAEGNAALTEGLVQRVGRAFVRLGSWGVSAAARHAERPEPALEVENYRQREEERLVFMDYRVRLGDFLWEVELVADAGSGRPLRRTLKESRGGPGWTERYDAFEIDVPLPDELFRPDPP